MKRLFWISVIIAILAAFFASTHPDGLDFVAKQFGFAQKGQERTAPMPDYSLKFLPEGGISTSLAGIAGVLITLAIFWLTAYILKKGVNGAAKSKVFMSLVCVPISLLNILKCVSGSQLFVGIFYFLYFIFNFSPVFAARPLVTDDFGTVDAGKFELEVGYNSTTPKAGGATTTGMVAQLKRGFTSNFDFGIEAPCSLTAPTGLGDATLHAKLKIMQTGENDGITARVDIKLTNGDAASGLGSGYNDYTIMLIDSNAFGDLRAHYNLSYTWVGVAPGAANADSLNLALAAEKEIAKGIDIVAECYSTSASGITTNNLQIGGRWQGNEMFRLDAGYSLALNDNSNNIATLGLTVEF